MKITKFGHCCLLIEERGLRILTDPGNLTTAQNAITDIDVVLITHEHADHYHVPSLLGVLKNNPEAIVITNSAVAKLLEAERVTNIFIVEHGQSHQVGQVLFSAFGKEHAVIYKDFTPVMNTGYFIGPRLFYPGDALYDPKKEDGREVEILALPVAGPWMKISEAIEYALHVAPKIAFPVHDGILAPAVSHLGTFAPSKVLPPQGIAFIPLELGKETEF
jgi:L-ascorbate metabolism protein UlaG (beta-lactamase superfamily)